MINPHKKLDIFGYFRHMIFIVNLIFSTISYATPQMIQKYNIKRSLWRRLVGGVKFSHHLSVVDYQGIREPPIVLLILCNWCWGRAWLVRSAVVFRPATQTRGCNRLYITGCHTNDLETYHQNVIK